MISAFRAAVRNEQRIMKNERREPFDANPASAVHRMLQSDALPSQLYSVVDSSGQLTSTAEELQELMVQHFEAVFALPPAGAASLSPAPPAMLFDKPGIEPSWFDSLTIPVSESELLDSLHAASAMSAPGEDGVLTGVWRIALHDCPTLRRLVAELLSACIRTSTFPSVWKSSAIRPFIKHD